MLVLKKILLPQNLEKWLYLKKNKDFKKNHQIKVPFYIYNACNTR